MNKRFLLLFVFALSVCHFSVAQEIEPYGFAGEDKEFFFLPTENVPLGVFEIGIDAPEDTECHFLWEAVSAPENPQMYQPFVSDRKKSKVNIQVWDEGYYLYRLCRVSKYGYQYEMVTVTILNEIRLVGANPKKNIQCWADEDPITIDQFDLTTEPCGYEAYVDLADDSRVAQNHNVWLDENNMDIHFIIHNRGMGEPPVDADYNDCHITVVDEVSSPNLTSPNIAKLKDVVENAKKATKIVDEVRDMQEEFKLCPKQFLTVVIPPDNGVYVDASYHESCCANSLGNYARISVTGKAAIGVEVNWPIWGPMVYLCGSLETGVNPSIAFNLSWDNSNCFGVDIAPLPFYFEGALGLKLGSPGLLDVSGSAVIGATGGIIFSYSDGWITNPETDFYVRFRAKITTPLATFQWEWDPDGEENEDD